MMGMELDCHGARIVVVTMSWLPPVYAGSDWIAPRASAVAVPEVRAFPTASPSSA